MEDPGKNFPCPAGSKVPGSTLLASTIIFTARPTETSGVGGLAEGTSSPKMISPPGLLGSQPSSKFYRTAPPLFFFLFTAPWESFGVTTRMLPAQPETWRSLLCHRLTAAQCHQILSLLHYPTAAQQDTQTSPAKPSTASVFRDGAS